MNRNSQENSEEVMRQLFGDEKAEEMLSDIAAGDAILGGGDVPEPSAELLDSIATRMDAKVSRRKQGWHVVLRYAAAAVLIIGIAGLVWMGIGAEESTKVERVSPMAVTSIWASEGEEYEYTEVGVLSSELDSVSHELIAIGLGENDTVDISAVDTFEDDLLEVDSTFWKG